MVTFFFAMPRQGFTAAVILLRMNIMHCERDYLRQQIRTIWIKDGRTFLLVIFWFHYWWYNVSLATV